MAVLLPIGFMCLVAMETKQVTLLPLFNIYGMTWLEFVIMFFCFEWRKELMR
jgi:hypothetical protein